MSSQEALLRYLYCIPASDCPQHLPLTAGSHFHTRQSHCRLRHNARMTLPQQFHINKPTLNRHSNRHFYASEKKSPQELLSPQIIFIFIEDSPVNKFQSENFAFRLSQYSHKIGVQWGYKFHSHSSKDLILSLFRQKYGFCRGR